MAIFGVCVMYIALAIIARPTPIKLKVRLHLYNNATEKKTDPFKRIHFEVCFVLIEFYHVFIPFCVSKSIKQTQDCIVFVAV